MESGYLVRKLTLYEDTIHPEIISSIRKLDDFYKYLCNLYGLKVNREQFLWLRDKKIPVYFKENQNVFANYPWVVKYNLCTFYVELTDEQFVEYALRFGE